jgi:hypothetical protein
VRAFLGLIFFGGLWAVGYALFNGVDGLYELFGADGTVLTGGALIIAGLSASAAALLVGAGVQEVEAEVLGRDGMLSHQKVRRFRPGLLVVGGLFGVIAAAILISGMD